jgi:hypothetical protein
MIPKVGHNLTVRFKPVRIYAVDGGGDYSIHGAVFDDQVRIWNAVQWKPDGESSIRQDWDLIFAKTLNPDKYK